MMLAEHRRKLDTVVRGVLGPVLRDYAKGVLDRADVDERARRCANAIRAAFKQSELVDCVCADCGCDLDPDFATVISGQLYCVGHAGKHRLPPPPRRFA